MIGTPSGKFMPCCSLGKIYGGRVNRRLTSTGARRPSCSPDRGRPRVLGSRPGRRYTVGGLTTDVALFQLNFDNQIEYDSIGANYVNVGKTLHRGVETSARYDLAALDPALTGLGIYATYAYTHATLEEGPYKGNDLRLYSRHTGTAGIGYATGRWHLDWFGYAQSAQFADEANTATATADGRLGRIPGWVIWNARVCYDVTPQSKLSLGVQNVFDKLYYTRASLEDNGGLYAGPPRTIYAELRLRF